MSEKTLALEKEAEGQAFLCARCGMCMQACPTFLETGSESMCARGRVQLLRGVIEGKVELTDRVRDRIYSCLGCNACLSNCPSGVEVESLILEARAAMREKGVALPTLQEALRGSLAGDGNPFGAKRGERGEWLPEKLRKPHAAEICIHAGCAVSYANSRTGKMILRLLDGAGVSYTFMGDEEECCGDPLVRLGETEAAHALQERNKARFRQYGIKRIVTPCAGCVKSFRNHYSEFASQHIVELLADLVREGKIKPEKPVKSRVIYFDGCDLGRHAGIYDPPREILRAIPGLELLEFDKRREFGQCCGGPLMANDPAMAVAIAAKRTTEAAAKNAEMIAVACPTCFINLRGGAKQASVTLDVQDVVGLLFKSVK